MMYYVIEQTHGIWAGETAALRAQPLRKLKIEEDERNKHEKSDSKQRDSVRTEALWTEQNKREERETDRQTR